MAGRNNLVISHWDHLTEGLQVSPQEFYSGVSQALKRRQVPDLRLSMVSHAEGNIFSAKREYLQISRKELCYDICAAPFGNGFFVSSWLAISVGCFWEFMLTFLPFIAVWLHKSFIPQTYYRLDTASMFQQSVHNAVIETLDQVCEAKGIRLLTEMERRPVIAEMFRQGLMRK